MPYPRSLVLGILLVCVLTSTVFAQTLTDPRLIADEVATGMSATVQMVFIGPDDIFVIEQHSGKVRRVTGGTIVGDVIDLDVQHYGGHFGLLGIALHPQFASNGFVYLNFFESSVGVDTTFPTECLGLRIYRYVWNGTSLTAGALMVDLPWTPMVFHHGGIMEFGPDEKLYVMGGDQTQGGVLQNHAPGVPSDSTSVIFRFNDDGTSPLDNPFSAIPNYEAYYAYGIRNGYGMDFDPVSGKLWDTENGPTAMDEINLVEPGFNSGWWDLMGPDARDPDDTSGLVMVAGAFYSDPEFSLLAPVGITAIEFLPSTALGSGYENDAFVGQVNSGDILHFEPNVGRSGFDFVATGLQDLVGDDGQEMSELLFGTDFGPTTDIDTGPDGNLYVLSYLGNIRRVRTKDFDLVTADAQLGASCDAQGEVCVTGSYDVYETTGPVASVQVEFYLDDPQVPANLLASFTDNDLGDGDSPSHNFCFTWPDSNAHDVIMIVDTLNQATEDLESNNQAVVMEECDEFVVSTPPYANRGFALNPNVPNPFNPRTTFSFELPQAGRASLDIYDIRGRHVVTVLDRDFPVGEHTEIWDANSDDGTVVAAGVYVARLTSSLGVLTRPITLLK